MTFAVDGLPAGLRVEPQTGRILGALPERGEFMVTLRASNAHGAAERTLKIVCGDTLALTPHMGWNSWYVWENRVTDKIMRDAADAMVSSGLIQHGYQYVNIDGCWSVKPGAKDPTLGGTPRDAQGKVNANGRFPDMKALTDYNHAYGLKAGIYTSPGPTTTPEPIRCGCFSNQRRFEAVTSPDPPNLKPMVGLLIHPVKVTPMLPQTTGVA